jgi:hypothetical protein
LVPLSGENKEIGQQIIKAVRIAVKDINSDFIEIIPRDTASAANKTLLSAIDLKNLGVQVVIGPVFFNSLIYLDEVKELTFLSLTNKTIDLPKNIISAGVNSTSQFNTIKKFIELNQIERAIFLTPMLDYEAEIQKGIKDSKIKVFRDYIYDIEPTKLTEQIEKITNYEVRKQNLYDEIYRVENLMTQIKKKK